MDMAWAEVTLKAPKKLQESYKSASSIFLPPQAAVITDDENSDDDKDKTESPDPWLPHMSIAYDDPSSVGLTLERVLEEAAKVPELLGEMRITGLSLWDLDGRRVEEWRKVDEYGF